MAEGYWNEKSEIKNPWRNNEHRWAEGDEKEENLEANLSYFPLYGKT